MRTRDLIAAAALALIGFYPEPLYAQTAPPATPSGSPSPKQSATPAPASSATPSGSPAPSASPSPTPTATPFKLITLSGSGDVGVTSPSGTDKLRFTNGTPSRVFDGVSVANDFPNTFALQNLNLQATFNGTFGGKVEASFGSDADVIASNGTSNKDGFDVTQAYLQYARGPVTFIAGKFATLAGAEVLESAGDFNFSRSFLFGLAIPFTHTGLRLTFAPTAKYSLIAGVNNGWDDVKFAGKKKTIEAGFALNASPAVTLVAQTYNGNDFTLNAPALANRMLYDTVLTVKATPALTLVGNYDNGTQLGAALVDATGTALGSGSAHWTGFAGYANYQFTPKFYVELRGESFRDGGGFRTGFDQRLHEGTITLGYAPSTPLLFRVEYRADSSDQPTFSQRGTAAGRSTQQTIGLEALAKF